MTFMSQEASLLRLFVTHVTPNTTYNLCNSLEVDLISHKIFHYDV